MLAVQGFGQIAKSYGSKVLSVQHIARVCNISYTLGHLYFFQHGPNHAILTFQQCRAQVLVAGATRR